MGNIGLYNLSEKEKDDREILKIFSSEAVSIKKLMSDKSNLDNDSSSFGNL
jgi:hypothetical protein